MGQRPGGLPWWRFSLNSLDAGAWCIGTPAVREDPSEDGMTSGDVVGPVDEGLYSQQVRPLVYDMMKCVVEEDVQRFIELDGTVATLVAAADGAAVSKSTLERCRRVHGLMRDIGNAQGFPVREGFALVTSLDPVWTGDHVLELANAHFFLMFLQMRRRLLDSAGAFEREHGHDLTTIVRKLDQVAGSETEPWWRPVAGQLRDRVEELEDSL